MVVSAYIPVVVCAPCTSISNETTHRGTHRETQTDTHGHRGLTNIGDTQGYIWTPSFLNDIITGSVVVVVITFVEFNRCTPIYKIP